MTVLRQHWLRIIAFIAGVLASCCAVPTVGRLIPEHKGVDPKLTRFVNEYLDLAKENGIKFDHKVTVGFKDIDNGNIVGNCYYSMGFREIDIDGRYWELATYTSKTVLIWHELSHCYCTRGHDYAKGKEYQNSGHDFWIRKDADLPFRHDLNEDGRFKDGCPKSIMYPVVLDDACTLAHYEWYTHEMFDRCNAW